MARDLNRLFEDLRNSREVYVTQDGDVEQADEAADNADQEERSGGRPKARTRLKPEIFGRSGSPLFVAETVLADAHRLAGQFSVETGAIGVGPDEHTLTALIPSGPGAKRTAGSFELDADYLQPLLERAEARGLRFVAFWHSHPQGFPNPSETDRAAARRMLGDPEWGLSGHVYLPISVRKAGGGFETRFFVARGSDATIEEASVVVISPTKPPAGLRADAGAHGSSTCDATVVVGADRLQRDQVELKAAGWTARLRSTAGGLALRAELRHLALWFVLPPEYPISAPDVYVEEEGGFRPIPLVDLPEVASWSSLRSLVALAAQARKSVEDLQAVESRILRPWSVPLIERVKSARALLPFIGAR